MTDIISPVIPVLDIMIGQVVWAKGGQRHEYRPVDSKLIQNSNPVNVAHAVYNQTGSQWLYVADIDSFAGANPNWAVYQSLIDAGFKLLIDADWISGNRIDAVIAEFANSDNSDGVKLIVSTETIESLDQFSILKKLLAAGIDVCFSIDMQGEHVIAKTPEVAALSPLQLVHQAYQYGVRNFILLNLETVGTNSGMEIETSTFDRKALITEIANELPDVRLVSGGGVRDHADCQAFLSAGCQQVLVASAIFDCRITPDEVAMLQPFRNHSKTRDAFVAKA
jgi:phosphoribosylformimino-5-aminoimidazole carboxamide ribotide isomerase